MEYFIDPDGVGDVVAKSQREFGELMAMLETCDILVTELVAAVEPGAPVLASRLRYMANTEHEARAKAFGKALEAQEALVAGVSDFLEYDATAADVLKELNSAL